MEVRPDNFLLSRESWEDWKAGQPPLPQSSALVGTLGLQLPGRAIVIQTKPGCVRVPHTNHSSL